MRHLVQAMMVIVGVIHLLPLAGVLGAGQLSVLYGISFGEPNLEILMRHRAVLFGLLGSFLIFASFRSAFQPVALIAAFASALSFLWLAWSIGSYNALLGRVLVADLIALACLLMAMIARVFTKDPGHAGQPYSGDTSPANKKA